MIARSIINARGTRSAMIVPGGHDTAAGMAIIKAMSTDARPPRH
jgi:hypothetical protein